MRPAVDITYRRFNAGTTRVAVCRNHLRKKADREYIWKISALDGKLAGVTVGLAVEVPLTGPVGYLGGSHPAITGFVSMHPIVLTNPVVRPMTTEAWQGAAPSAAILTSDGEVWTVSGPMKDQPLIRYWDKDFNEIPDPTQVVRS